MFKTIDVVVKELDGEPDKALVLMGHGTSHQINPIYAALDYMFKEMGYPRVYVGTVEAYPSLPVIVGFVNVVQSKELLMSLTATSYIVAEGRKGGSNIAACICNALLYML